MILDVLQLKEVCADMVHLMRVINGMVNRL